MEIHILQNFAKKFREVAFLNFARKDGLCKRLDSMETRLVVEQGAHFGGRRSSHDFLTLDLALIGI